MYGPSHPSLAARPGVTRAGSAVYIRAAQRGYPAYRAGTVKWSTSKNWNKSSKYNKNHKASITW